MAEREDDPPIRLRAAGDARKEEEKDEKKGAGALLEGASGAARGPQLLESVAAGRVLPAVTEAGVSAAESGGAAARLLSPLRSALAFLRHVASLGLVEGAKYALRSVVVQGLLAGLAVAL